MKKLLLILLFGLLSIFIYAHESDVHKYLTDQALHIIPYGRYDASFVNVLKKCSYTEDIPNEKDDIGIVEKKDPDNIGDPIYGYNCKAYSSKCLYFGLLKISLPITTSTHFWNQDYNFPFGDDKVSKAKVYYRIIGGIITCEDTLNLGTYDNAFKKARHYWLGDKDVMGWKKQDIFDYYGDSEINPIEPGGSIWRLGRIIHLLEDMNVPAHVHNDPHGGFLLGGDDQYEKDWIPKKHDYYYNDKLQ